MSIAAITATMSTNHCFCIAFILLSFHFSIPLWVVPSRLWTGHAAGQAKSVHNQALPPSASLLLVGDVHQLPSVGLGIVLRSLIESGLVPVVGSLPGTLLARGVMARGALVSHRDLSGWIVGVNCLISILNPVQPYKPRFLSASPVVGRRGDEVSNWKLREHRRRFVRLVLRDHLDLVGMPSLDSSVVPIVNLVVSRIWPFRAKAEHHRKSRCRCFDNEQPISADGMRNPWPVTKATRR